MAVTADTVKGQWYETYFTDISDDLAHKIALLMNSNGFTHIQQLGYTASTGTLLPTTRVLSKEELDNFRREVIETYVEAHPTQNAFNWQSLLPIALIGGLLIWSSR